MLNHRNKNSNTLSPGADAQKNGGGRQKDTVHSCVLRNHAWVCAPAARSIKNPTLPLQPQRRNIRHT